MNLCSWIQTFEKIHKIPACAGIELMQEDLFALNNEFKVTFFEGNTMFEKTYLFRRNTINEKALQSIPLMKVKGILVKQNADDADSCRFTRIYLDTSR